MTFLLARPAASVRPVMVVPNGAMFTLGEDFDKFFIPYAALAYLVPREVAQFTIPRFPFGNFKGSLNRLPLTPPDKYWFLKLKEIVDVVPSQGQARPTHLISFEGNFSHVLKQLEKLRDHSNTTVIAAVVLTQQAKDPRGVHNPMLHLFHGANRSVTLEFMRRGLGAMAPTPWAWNNFSGTQNFGVREMAFVFIRYDMYACNMRVRGAQGERVCLPRARSGITKETFEACKVREDEKNMCMVAGRAYIDGLLEIGAKHGIRQWAVSVKTGFAGPEMHRLLHSLPNATKVLRHPKQSNWANFLNMELAYRSKLLFADPGSLWVDWPMMRRNAEKKPVILTEALSPTDVRFTEANEVCLRARGLCRLLPIEERRNSSAYF